jgi:chemotaxis protein methyltransferase CheR
MTYSNNSGKEHPNFEINLGEKDYLRLSSFIMSQYGIKLPPNKRVFLQARLLKRLRHLQYTSFKDYVDYVFSSEGIKNELANLVDAVSTNKTDFFREPVHFEFLRNHGLKTYLELTHKTKLNIWSAGCSSGEEPYSIAISLKEHLLLNQYFDFNILATDISEGVLELAKIGIYTDDKMQMMKEVMLKKYFIRGKGEYANKLRINPEIRSKISFQKFNLLSPDYRLLGKFDIIFCRNVLIYFERDVQKRILNQFCEQLNKGGFLLTGHSESLAGFSLPLKNIKPTIYTRIDKE